jgi:N6-L-threonylcarbamoyladenine synthase
MKILAIETSCDETAIALVEVKNEKGVAKFKILGNEISSQIDIHKEFGGVYPALAKREHIKNLPIVFEKILKQAKIKEENISKEIEAIAVTTGPGLEPALWTGIVFAKELNKKYKIPLIPVNHMEGHIFSIFPKKGKSFIVENNKKMFPMLSLLVSGGHTELVYIKDWMKYKKLGQTRDDASGEAFDKVARMMGLPYPGGPEIGRLASIERENVVPRSLAQDDEPSTSKNFSRNLLRADGNNISSEILKIQLPRPMMYSKDYDFSFSGLKTAVLYLIRDLKEKDPNVLDNIKIKQIIAREFEDACFEVLSYKTMKALKEYRIQTLIVGGGVSASPQLKNVILNAINKNKLKVKTYFPGRGHTGDNALMIAIAGYYQYKNKKFVRSHKSLKLKANGNLSL